MIVFEVAFISSLPMYRLVLCKNIVFLAQAECSYFSADLKLKIFFLYLKSDVTHITSCRNVFLNGLIKT